MITDELKKDAVVAFLKEGKRLSGRAFDEYRQIVVEKDVLTSTEGSARVRIGNTQVLVGVKVDLSTPFKDKPDEGTLTVGASLLPLASPTFEPGPPDERSIELARVVDRGIRSAEAVDLKALKIEEDKVWGIFADIYVLDHDGNLIDASALATVAALENLRIPKYVDEEVVRETSMILPLKEKPITFTFAKIGDTILYDPDYAEEVAMDARFTVCVGDEYVYAMQKSGKGSFTRKEITDLIEAAFAKRKELLKYL